MSFVWYNVCGTKMNGRIDCGFYVIIPRTDRDGRDHIRKLYEETMEQVRIIQDESERAQENKFLKRLQERREQMEEFERIRPHE